MPTSLQPREQEWSRKRQILPFMFGKEKLGKKEKAKIELFEAGLSAELKKTDTINSAITKMVRMALAAEFGPTLVKSKGAEHMISTIVTGILSDHELRKQALSIIDQFAK